MDAINRFETPTTLALHRLEYAAVLGLSLTLLVVHRTQVNWHLFVALFAIIDLIGYIPGAIAHRRSRGSTAKLFYILYNTMHSVTTWLIVLSVWSVSFGPEWAFLAVPIHLAGDRALFGNFLKSFKVPYEPALHPAFSRFDADLASHEPSRSAP
jgi:hypothetical protein